MRLGSNIFAARYCLVLGHQQSLFKVYQLATATVLPGLARYQQRSHLRYVSGGNDRQVDLDMLTAELALDWAT